LRAWHTLGPRRWALIETDEQGCQRTLGTLDRLASMEWRAFVMGKSIGAPIATATKAMAVVAGVLAEAGQ
jgi:hypothetical protein